MKYYKISSDDLVTLSKIEKPSETLHMLFQALGILQGIPPSTYKLVRIPSSAVVCSAYFSIDSIVSLETFYLPLL